MSPTPSASSSDLISRAASRKSLPSPPTAPRRPEQARAAMIVMQPRRVQLVVPRRGAEVPDVRIAVAGQQRVARELVARPLADHGAGRVADVVLVEAQQRAEARVARARRACARAGSRAAAGSRRAPRNRPACGPAPAAAGPSGDADRCRRAGRSSAPRAFFFAIARSSGSSSALPSGLRSSVRSTYFAGSVSVFCGTPYLLRSASTVRMPSMSSARVARDAALGGEQQVVGLLRQRRRHVADVGDEQRLDDLAIGADRRASRRRHGSRA